MRRGLSSKFASVGLAFSTGFALLLLTTPAVHADDRENPPSRPRPPAVRAPSPPSAPSPAPAPRPPSTSSPSGSGSGSSSSSGGYGHGRSHGRGYGYGYGYGYGHYGHRYHFGYSHYWPYSRFYYSYHQPYYPWGMVWYPAYTANTRTGAIDLAIKPKKASVYVDGQYVGTAGKFDGFPGYLWLSEGSHQLVFHREGYETVERRVRVRVGPVIELRAEMPEGVATDPEALFEPEPKTVVAERERPAPSRRPELRDDTERRAELDLRGEPGRFRLEVAPLDASIYLDGRFLGSGEELSRLHAGMMVDAGEHVLDIQRPGYESERVEFSVEPGDETEITVALNSAQAPSG